MRVPFFGSSFAAEAAAIRKSQAVIEFDLSGRILDANENFLKVVGYARSDVVGKPHAMFVDASYATSDDYAAFWKRLKAGEAIEAQFLRVGKDKRLIWLQATYTPILDASGRPEKVIKFATDITAMKGFVAGLQGQVDAIRKSQAVIEFDLDGTILDANDHFLDAVGYSLAEIKGRHHGMFVGPEIRASAAYGAFWQKLGQGAYDAGQYQRLAKGGRSIWLQASYNPILDALGKPYKVVKYATDITQSKADGDLRSAVAETRSVVQAAKNGDLTHRIPLVGKSGDIADLCEGINELVESTAGIIASLGAISSRISDGALSISQGSLALAQRTEEQASSLEETAATTEQLSASVKQSAGLAQDATALGAAASHVADDGGVIVKEAMTAMERIEKASSDIAEIVTLIDNIAFQTNLLALNAAVEAARAGDSGRGFAVVASEVRALAQRSSDAAKGIKALISNSTREVATGVRLVSDAGDALSRIVASSTHVATALADISSATNEQSNGIEEVAKVVAHMDDMTQRNSAMADQSAAVAHDLKQATDSLQRLIRMYKIDPARSQSIVGRVSASLPVDGSEQAASKALPHLGDPATGDAVTASPGLDRRRRSAF